MQQQTLNDMTGSMNLARDTANVATAAVRLSQVVGALEYKSEADRLKQTYKRHCATRWNSSPMHHWRSRSRYWWRESFNVVITAKCDRYAGARAAPSSGA